MSAAVQSQLVASLVTIAKDAPETDTDWHGHAVRLVELIKSPHITAEYAAELLAGKLRFAQAIGFGRGLDRAAKMLGA